MKEIDKMKKKSTAHSPQPTAHSTYQQHVEKKNESTTIKHSRSVEIYNLEATVIMAVHETYFSAKKLTPYVNAQ